MRGTAHLCQVRGPAQGRRFAGAVWRTGSVLAMLVAFAPVALASGDSETEADTTGKAKVTVLVIRASKTESRTEKQHEGISEKLAEQLKKSLDFKSLKLLSQKSRSGAYGKKQVFPLPEKMELVVTPLDKQDGRIRLQVLLLRPPAKSDPEAKKKTVLNMKVTLPRKQGFPIVGPKLADGGRLVLVVSAE